jgi:mannitol-specific phosphotransferase system IIBC component
VLALCVARGRGWTAGALEAASAASVVGVAALVPRGALTEIGAGFLATQLVVAACAAVVLIRFRRTVTDRKESST